MQDFPPAFCMDLVFKILHTQNVLIPRVQFSHQFQVYLKSSKSTFKRTTETDGGLIQRAILCILVLDWLFCLNWSLPPMLFRCDLIKANLILGLLWCLLLQVRLSHDTYYHATEVFVFLQNSILQINDAPSFPYKLSFN